MASRLVRYGLSIWRCWTSARRSACFEDDGTDLNACWRLIGWPCSTARMPAPAREPLLPLLQQRHGAGRAHAEGSPRDLTERQRKWIDVEHPNERLSFHPRHVGLLTGLELRDEGLRLADLLSQF